MANNRIYIRCLVCGETMFMGKSFLNGYFYERYQSHPEPLDERLNAFYEKHHYFHDKGDETKCVGYDKDLFPMPKEPLTFCDGAFDLVYESNDGNTEMWPDTFEQTKKASPSGEAG